MIQVFGPNDKSVAADDEKATGPLLVDMEDPPAVTSSSSWDIWTAGIAVYTMCIEDGKEGTYYNLGESSVWGID